MSITHKFVSAVSDGADTSVVRPSNWNDTHQIDNSTITEAMLSISDNTTANVSTSAHGFAPKVTNTSNYLKGDGTWSNPGSNSGPTFPGGIPLTGVKYVCAYGSALAIGDNDLTLTSGGTATVPANKRWMVVGGPAFNTSAGTIASFLQVKVSATYYRLSSTSSLTTGTGGSFTVAPYIAEAGETISVNVATTNGLNVAIELIEFDNANALSSPKITSVSAGNNTVYTVTTGKTGMLLSVFSTFPNGLGTARISNASGGSRTYSMSFTPSGGSAIQTQASFSSGNNTVNTGNIPATLNSGDNVIINVDAGTATQMIWVNVMEI